MFRTFALALLLPLLALLAWLGLAARTPPADFVVASEEPRTIDPHRVSLLGEMQVARACWEGLTRPNEGTLLPEAGVAERWDYDPQTLTYTFHLRPDARWSNGAAVTAEDFRYAWLRVLNPRLASQYYALLFAVAGAERYFNSRLNQAAEDDLPAESVGVAAVDARTLRVTLAQPCSYFLDLTSFPTLAPVYPPTIERWRGPDGRIATRDAPRWTRPEHVVCNGAFVPAAWEFKKTMRLQRNEHYWERAAIDLDSIEVLVAPEPNLALLAYETGRVHLVRSLSNTTARVLYEQAQAGQRPDFVAGPRFATFFFRLNCSRPPLDNADFRRALALAVDRETLAGAVMGMGEEPAYTYVPRGSVREMPRSGPDGGTVLYEPPAGLGAGLARGQREELARELLRVSGFDPRRGRAIEITYASQLPDYQRVAESVQAMWERVLGLRVTLRALESKVLSSEVRQLSYDVVRADWYGDYMDPSTFLDMFTTGNGQNRTGWSNPRYDELIAAAAAEPDNRRRFALFREAEALLCEEQVPIVPLFFRTGSYLLAPGFTGLRDNSRETLLIHRVRRVRP